MKIIPATDKEYAHVLLTEEERRSIEEKAKKRLMNFSGEKMRIEIMKKKTIEYLEKTYMKDGSDAMLRVLSRERNV